MTHWEIRVLPTALVLLFISLFYGTFRRQQIIPQQNSENSESYYLVSSGLVYKRQTTPHVNRH